MPGSFIDRRERGNEELKSKGNGEGEAVRKSSARVFSLVRHLQGKGQPSEGGCSSLPFIGRQEQATSPPAEQRHFSLQSDRGSGSSRQAIENDYNNKSKSKKQFPTWSQNWFPPSNKISHKPEDNTMDMVWFHVYEVPRIGKFIETENRSYQGLGVGALGMGSYDITGTDFWSGLVIDCPFRELKQLIRECTPPV